MFLALALILASRTEATLNVFAAASLKEAFTEIARRFESAHPGTRVRLNFGGSQLLAAQIGQGAPCDVFASADERNLDKVSFDPQSRRVFAENRLTVVVRTSYSGLTSLADLSKARRMVVADPSVPVGGYTQEFLDKAAHRFGQAWASGVRSHIVSKEQDVRAVLAKIVLGEGDAGVVYQSDARTALGNVRTIAVPDDLNVLARYPVAVPSRAPSANMAKDFVKFLFDPASQSALVSRGFLSPLRPSNRLSIVEAFRSVAIPLPLAAKYPKVTEQVVGHDGAKETVTGVLVPAILPRTPTKNATFVGADDYEQVIPIAELVSRKAILVRGLDGNYQLIVPGMPPKFWVHWLRVIILQ